MQLGKLAAAARIASACMSGWPEPPDSPLQSSLLTGPTGAGGVDEPPNRRPMLPVKKPSCACADTGPSRPTDEPTSPAETKPAATRRYRLPPVMLRESVIQRQRRGVPPAPLGDQMWLQYV